ncbi:MAG TPA: lipocalin-like domain-containing protein [Caulobacteraceae bacterium]|nr:lipocalin-like domain-containing protein [Caulobacteraceae bacterium]
MNKMLLAAAAVALLAASGSSYAGQTTTKSQIVGTWQVVRVKDVTGGGVSYPLGERPTGYVTVTPTRIWLMFVDSTRTPPARAAQTDAEAVASMKSHAAWTGRYVTANQTPDGVKVVAHVDSASNQALTGTDRVYLMRVDGNKLTMTSPGVIAPMTGKATAVEIDLVRAD